MATSRVTPVICCLHQSQGQVQGLRFHLPDAYWPSSSTFTFSHSWGMLIIVYNLVPQENRNFYSKDLENGCLNPMKGLAVWECSGYNYTKVQHKHVEDINPGITSATKIDQESTGICETLSHSLVTSYIFLTHTHEKVAALPLQKCNGIAKKYYGTNTIQITMLHLRKLFCKVFVQYKNLPPIKDDSSSVAAAPEKGLCEASCRGWLQPSHLTEAPQS
ncbi:hypothetical protein Anapl_01873 [Anas platyrhynchos]|uniref:Uncharacterized protein n=1 Tax=Anas platyrhynchos TaxID=8839 RepID=R0M7J8_ANAPL|nr:hypothetical protein Anapl_01873 [Anas platyrhynchos]